MSSSDQGRGVGGDAGLGEIVSALTRDMQDLVTGQVELAKAEFKQSARSAATGGGLFAGAAVLAVFGIFFLFLTIGFALNAAGLSTWLSFLIVTVLLLTVGGVLAGIGMRNVKRVQGPERTIASARATAETLNRLKGD